MAGTLNAGSIVYEVDMDTARLLAARREVDAALNGMGANMGRLDASVTRTERSLSSMQGTLSSLTGVAKGLIAALSVQQVAEWGNEWVTVNNKLANSVRATEQLSDVTQRVFDISQNTMSSLQATATLYGRLERATRSAGTSTQDLITLTSTINKGLAVSGATTEEASSTMTQLSQALASGVLRGEEFNSISENGSRLAVALADSLGVTIGQLRAMAAEGKLTTEVVVNGLLKQSNAIAKEFANTAMTMGQAITIATNNITKFVGESSSVSTSIKVFNDGVIGLSQNLEVVANVIGAAAVIFGGRFAGALALATKSRIDDALAARAQTAAIAESAAATANSARVTTLKAGLDKEQALSNLALAQTEYNVAKGTAAETFALENLIAVKSVAIQRSAAFSEAQLVEAAATRTATAAAAAATTTVGSLARGALALIGGPAGVAVIAAAGIFYFYQKMQQARQESISFADKLDDVIAKMKNMSQVQLAAEIDNASRSIKAQADALKDNQATIEANELQQDRLRRTLSYLSEGSLLYKATLSELADAQSEHTQLLAENERAQNKLSQTVSKTGILRAQMNGTFEQGIDLLKRDGHEAGVAASLMSQLGNAIDFAGRAKDKFNSSSLQVQRPAKVQDYLDKLLDQVEVEGEIDERKRAQLKVEKEIRALGGDDAAVNLARQRAAAEYDAQKAQQALKKEASAAASEQKKAANQAESIAQKLERLKQQSEMVADSTREMSREQAILTAQQSLGKGATSAQIAQAGEYAAKRWDTANAIKAQAAAEKLLPEAKENASYKQDVQDLDTALAAKKISQEQYNATSEQLEATHQTNLAKIRANQAVTPQQEAAGTVDPVQQLANENARKLALIQQFEQQRIITEQQSLALRNAANTEYEQQRVAAQWEIWRNQSAGNEALAASFDALAGNASNALTGIITGSMSAEDAMRSIGNTVLNSLINTFVQMGVEWAKSAILGATTQQTAIAATTAVQTAAVGTQTAVSVAAAGTTAAAWTPAAILSSIASMGTAAAIGLGAVAGVIGMNLLGKRKNGGPVSAGGLYQVGESGLPEIYQASNGRQYMIPGDNGSVISNKDMLSGGGINVQLNVQNYSGATVDAQASSDGNGGVTIDMIVADLNNGGPVSQGIVGNFNVKRKARGQG
ncbi:MAG: tape measure protein [Mixta calida]|uniref:tape measure protein n=1 Tax=Mixta calida TaxID=665913 RepID=UPI0028A09C8B|nr:tape measure protein [Mixta calida]MDU5828840.1 tape measure protein [Mixta calida]